MIHYRKLEIGEDLQPGDEWPGALGPYIVRAVCAGSHPSNKVDKVGWLRPITEAPPPAPVHRVEDETYRIGFSTGDLRHVATVGAPSHRSQDVCRVSPHDDGNWDKRAKRICAGQEALKFLESDRVFCIRNSVVAKEIDRILSMLKD